MMKYQEKISDLNDNIGSVISLASSKKEFIGKQIINGFLLFIILLVFGCLDFATLTFHLEYLLTASYWGTVFSKTVAGVCAFNIGINLMWEAEILKDRILDEAITTYKRLNSYRKSDFEHFVVHIYNPKEKTKAYISQINRRIYLLNKVSRAKDRLLYSSDLPEKQAEKLTNRYCILRQQLEDLKKPDFVEKNLDSLKVKYLEVDPTVFDLEIDGAIPVHGTKTKGNVAIGKVKASSNVVFGMVGFSMFITAIGLELNAEQFADQMEAFWHYLLKCATDIFIILWQTLRGMLKVRKIISSELTQPYVGRNKVLKDYYTWQKENNLISEEQYYNIIEGKEEYIEVTEEQLKEIKSNG